MHIRWTEEALADLEGIARYLEKENVTAAQTVTSAIVAAVEAVGSFSHRGRLGFIPGTRELVLSAIGFIIVYEVVRDAVFILEIRHGSQDRPQRL